jgi:hypothetical protein
LAALGDLVDLELDDALAALPTPQREALEVALLRRTGTAARATRPSELLDWPRSERCAA